MAENGRQSKRETCNCGNHLTEPMPDDIPPHVRQVRQRAAEQGE